jgi:hypothetical protein
MTTPVLPEDSAASTTTAEQNRVTAGQRHINVMWERTQQILAIALTVGCMAILAYIIVWGERELKLVAFAFLTNITLLVVNTYFQRTNHTRTGGVGPRRGNTR